MSNNQEEVNRNLILNTVGFQEWLNGNACNFGDLTANELVALRCNHNCRVVGELADKAIKEYFKIIARYTKGLLDRLENPSEEYGELFYVSGILIDLLKDLTSSEDLTSIKRIEEAAKEKTDDLVYRNDKHSCIKLKDIYKDKT